MELSASPNFHSNPARPGESTSTPGTPRHPQALIMSKAPCGLDSSPGIVFPVVRHSLMLLVFLLEHSLKQTSSADSLVPPGGAWVRVSLAHTPLSHLSFTLHILPSQTPAPTTPNHPPLLHYPPPLPFLPAHRRALVPALRVQPCSRAWIVACLSVSLWPWGF